MIVVHHNPRCSKSRAVLSLLEEADEPFVRVDYLESAWTRGQLIGRRAREKRAESAKGRRE